MARRRSGSNREEGLADGEIRTTEWSSSSPRRPPTHSLRFDHEDRRHVVNYCAAWAAKKALDHIIEDEKFKWLDRRTILLDSGLRVQSDDLEELMELELGRREEEWDFPDYELRKFAMIKLKKVDIEREKAERAPRQVSSEPLPPRKEQRERVPRSSREGLVTVQMICEELGIDPREARQFFRKQKLEKPSAGWAWEEGRANEIRKMLKGMPK
jgi:hypothetical protein